MMDRESWADAFRVEECRTARQRQLVDAFVARAAAWEPVGTYPADVAVSGMDDGGLLEWVILIDVTAASADHVLRTLRLELAPGLVAVGDDFTGQGHPLDRALQDVTTFRGDGTSAKTAVQLGVNWIEAELRRPIEEHVWQAPGYVHRRTILADSGRCLSWSDTLHDARRPLVGPPSEIRRLRGA
jgi:hypothetical protein